MKMTKVLWSTHSFDEADDEKVIEFLNIVKDIVEVPEYRELLNHTHHKVTSRYQHCLNVAWYCYWITRQAGLDYVSAARAGMLHDFYLYDGYRCNEMRGRHAEVHPRIALRNAEKFFQLNEIEKDCILHHMWPVSHTMPKTREGMIITVVDKYCAAIERTSGEAVKIPAALRRAYHYMLARV